MSEFFSRLKRPKSLFSPPSDPESAGQTDRSTHMINTAQLQEGLICICINRGKNNNSITYGDILHTKEHMQTAWKKCSQHFVWLCWAHMGQSQSPAVFKKEEEPVTRCLYSYYTSSPHPLSFQKMFLTFGQWKQHIFSMLFPVYQPSVSYCYLFTYKPQHENSKSFASSSLCTHLSYFSFTSSLVLFPICFVFLCHKISLLMN